MKTFFQHYIDKEIKGTIDYDTYGSFSVLEFAINDVSIKLFFPPNQELAVEELLARAIRIVRAERERREIAARQKIKKEGEKKCKEKSI